MAVGPWHTFGPMKDNNDNEHKVRVSRGLRVFFLTRRFLVQFCEVGWDMEQDISSSSRLDRWNGGKRFFFFFYSTAHCPAGELRPRWVGTLRDFGSAGLSPSQSGWGEGCSRQTALQCGGWSLETSQRYLLWSLSASTRCYRWLVH